MKLPYLSRLAESKFRSRLTLALALALFLPVSSLAGGDLTRQQKMVVNLTHGVGSCGFYLLESRKLSEDMAKNLRKAAYQVREVDKSYAKSLGRPDDRFLEPAALRIARCRDKADELTVEIRTAFQDLKDEIKESLLQPTLQGK